MSEPWPVVQRWSTKSWFIPDELVWMRGRIAEYETARDTKAKLADFWKGNYNKFCKEFPARHEAEKVRVASAKKREQARAAEAAAAEATAGAAAATAAASSTTTTNETETDRESGTLDTCHSC